MLGSFYRCKYMNVCKLLNLCMFVVEKLKVIEMLWSFDRCNVKNEYMRNVNVKNEYMGNVNVRSECGKLMLGMLGSFDKCKYMNVWNEC